MTNRMAGKLSAVVAGLAIACAGSAAHAAPDQGNADLVARGQYLATAGDCTACHTKEGGQPFAGGRVMDTPFGGIPTPNITPDKATGIGDWTDDEFYRLFHQGIGKHGEYIYPAMPYPWYTRVVRCFF